LPQGSHYRRRAGPRRSYDAVHHDINPLANPEVTDTLFTNGHHYRMLTDTVREIMGKGKPAQVHRKKEEKTLVFSVDLSDCIVQHFRCGGPGGQKQNKTSSGSRVIHPPSGARGESREERSQPQNTRIAFIRMVQSKKFEIWKQKMLWGNRLPPEEQVELDMDPSNLLIMAQQQDGKWRIID